MTTKVAIIGSGPTGIYTLAGLIGQGPSLSITVFEAEADAGKGTPYHPDANDQVMLANIASVELPPIRETLVAWLRRQTDEELARLNVARQNIKEREFYPRVVIGEYLQSQFLRLVEEGSANGHAILIRPNHRIVDIRLRPDDIQVSAALPNGDLKEYAYDHVVMATGHNWPETTEVKPGYFISPWPAPALKTIKPCSIGILGTSLSAIDALMTVATAHGAFYLDPAGQLQYRAAAQSEAFSASLMSRKGVLPEADFYCEYPYRPLQVCTTEAIDAEIEIGSRNLLNRAFDLFKQELAAADPGYAQAIGLSLLTVETFSNAYFAAREESDPFVWAAMNLAEAEDNKTKERTVEWRYAILRMHEVIARVVPLLDEADLRRFHKHLKTMFVDDYATVPHQSIQRVLALRRAGKLDVLKLGTAYKLHTDGLDRGAVLEFGGERKVFGAFIDATGQSAMSARDLPFPSLVEQGVVSPATTTLGNLIIGEEDESFARTGGLDLDRSFRPIFEENLCNKLYCAAISFLLHKLPFVQGLTSAKELGDIVSTAILDKRPATVAGTNTLESA
jgi:uncharacterized NAD(P)/FAD-binding protein YdhS